MKSESGQAIGPPPTAALDDAKGGLRDDIEGLRALAVGLVIVNHLLGFPHGGFIGVDVFFVISGFLISGLLIAEYERNGRINFREFYARRIRRIMPAALTTLIVTCVVARLIFFDSRAREVYTDALWAAASLANWHMAFVGTDYFQSTRPPSAIQQYWSLAVAAQFYMVWPLVIALVGLLWAGARKHTNFADIAQRKIRFPLAWALGMITVLSFMWALKQSDTEPTIAYFSTLTRVWELGGGGLLAVATHQLRRTGRLVSAACVWGGFILVSLSAIITPTDGGFPSPWAAPAVIGAMLIIAGGTSHQAVTNLILSNRVSRFFGRISYSLYLWHWPIVIFGLALIPEPSLLTNLTTLVLIVGISAVSYVLIEQPIRKTTYLSASQPGRTPRGLTPRIQLVYTCVLASTALIGVGVAVRPVAAIMTPAASSAASSIPTTLSTAPTSGSDAEAIEAKWQQPITDALNASTWPDLTPSLDALQSSRAKQWSACGNVGASNMADCRFGPPGADPSKTVVVLGDSIGISWMPAFLTGFEKRGWAVQGLTFGECPAPELDVTSHTDAANFTARCSEHQSFALKQAADMKPAIIVLSSTSATLKRLPCCSAVDQAADAWRKATQNAVEKLKGDQTKVFILGPPPVRKDLTQCATKVATPADCVSKVDATWMAMAQADTAAAKASGAIYVDTKYWSCSYDDRCPGFVGSTPIMADGIHFTDAFAQQLGDSLFGSMQ